MDVTIKNELGVTVVAVSGTLEAVNAPELGRRLDSLLAQGAQQFVIDLSGLRFLDSSGIAVLVRLFKRVRIGHGDVRLSGAQPAVGKLLALVRLDRVFDIYAESESAVASFAGACGVQA